MNDLNQSASAVALLISNRAQHIPVHNASLSTVRRRASQRRSRQRASVGVTGLALLGGAVGVTQLRSDPTTRVVTSTDPIELPDSLTVPPSTVVQVTATTPASEKTQLRDELEIHSTGLAVVALQARLKELAFDPGPADGYFGFGTRQAVWAFEKLVLGTAPAKATGVVTNEMWQIMQDPIVIAPRRMKHQIYGERPTHVEIYLDTQVLIVFTDDKPVLITHISSGSNEVWCELITYSINHFGEQLPEPRTADQCGESITPGGVFAFYTRYEGHQLGTLGEMWNPVFFNYGIAVYGSDSVPLTPRSHGGIAIPMMIAEYFPTLVENNDRVYVWDGLKEPEEYTKEDKAATPNYEAP
ncbi:MAG: peptidoglycan-binding domain-containing protein [Ilumatobacteraceae bacterium]